MDAVRKRGEIELWNSDSETAHSLCVGFYGRSTAIDIRDIFLSLPMVP